MSEIPRHVIVEREGYGAAYFLLGRGELLDLGQRPWSYCSECGCSEGMIIHMGWNECPGRQQSGSRVI